MELPIFKFSYVMLNFNNINLIILKSEHQLHNGTMLEKK